MFTAMQSANLCMANHLVKAREELIACRSFICNSHATVVKVDSLITEVDELLAKRVPNKGDKDCDK